MIVRMFFLFLVFSFAYAQQNPATAQNAAPAQQGDAAAAQAQSSSMTDPASRLQRYNPSSQEALNLDPSKTERDYQVIARIIDDSEKKFADVIATYADYGASEYYNAYVRNVIDPYSFDTKTDFYPAARSTANRTSKLGRDIDLLQKAIERFNLIRPELAILGKTPEELANVDYKLHNLTASLLTMRGNPSDLRKAKDGYVYLLFGGSDDEVKPLVTDPEKIKQSYQLLVGVNKMIIQTEKNDAWRRKEVADHLFYLWNLADVLTSGNQPLKDMRFNNLIKKYALIINVDDRRYANFYKKYFEELAKTDLEIAGLLKSTDSGGSTAAPTQGGTPTPTPTAATPQ